MAQIYVNSGLVKPKAIHVYSGLSWLENKVGYVYENGEWISFIEYTKTLYDYGVEVVSWGEVKLQGTPYALEKNADHFRVLCNGSSGQIEGGFRSEGIDLSKYSKAFVEWENTGADATTNQSKFVATLLDSNATVANLTKTRKFSKTIDELDISALEGVYNLSVLARKHSVDNVGYSVIRVYKIWLE